MTKRNFGRVSTYSRLPFPFAASILICVLATQANIHIEAETLDSILKKASSLVGNPYRVGGAAPGGFDCSGLITYLYKPSLPNLPRLSRDMNSLGKEVEPGQWKPCDLLFYATGSDSKRINHVALWYGDDMLIHSVSNGPETGVIITRASSKYWKDRYVSARRVLPEEETAPGEITAASLPPSPWDDFNGILRGDFESWLEKDKRDFDSYREKNG